MTGIVIAGHGSFPEGLVNAVELVAGAAENITAVSFHPGQGIEELKENIYQAIQAIEGNDVLLMTDIIGGSPCNVAAALLLEGVGKNVKLVVGINMAALIQAVFSRTMIPFEELPAEVVKAGKEGITDYGRFIKIDN